MQVLNAKKNITDSLVLDLGRTWRCKGFRFFIGGGGGGGGGR